MAIVHRDLLSLTAGDHRERSRPRRPANRGDYQHLDDGQDVSDLMQFHRLRSNCMSDGEQLQQ